MALFYNANQSLMIRMGGELCFRYSLKEHSSVL